MSFLQGYRVVELASVLAGPLVGSFLGELGAQVIKVENEITNGDVTRQWKNGLEDPGVNMSSYYVSANNNKDTIFLDFTLDEDRQTLEALIKEADIVISNFQKRVGEKFEIDPYSITKKYPHIIYAQLDAYSYQDSRSGYDMVMQAEAGYLSMTGTKEGELAKIPVAFMDILAAHHLKEAILLALLQKAKSGEGSIVFVSLFDAAITGLVNQATNYLNQNLIARPSGTLHPNIAPYGEIFTIDGKAVLIAIGSDKHFEKFAHILKFSQSLKQRFSTNLDRVKNRDLLRNEILSHLVKLGNNHILTLLESDGIPFGIVKEIDEVLDNHGVKHMIKLHNNKMKYIKNTAFDIVINKV